MRTFLAILEEGSFTRASEILGMTQQAVSAQMKRLDAVVGRPLLFRQGASIRPTSDGEALAGYMRQVLAIAERVDTHFSAIPMAGSIRVGITEAFASTGLAAVLAGVHQQRPDVKVTVEVGRVDQLLVRMDNKRLDLVLGAQRTGAGHGTPLWSDRLRWVGDTEPYAEPSVPLPLAARPEPNMIRSIMIEALTRVGKPFEVVFESDSLSSLRAAIGTGLGVGALNDGLLGDEPTQAEPDYLPDLGEVEYFLRVDDEQDSIVQAFANLVRSIPSSILRRGSREAFN